MVGRENTGAWGTWSSLGPNANILLLQEAAYHPEVAPDVRLRALRYGRECANGYLELLDHVLLVRQELSAPHTSLPKYAVLFPHASDPVL